MSYREYYSETITVSGSESYSYPPSENGGSGRVTVYIDVPINIQIEVNTHPFDHSVDRAENNITTLTEAVIASELAGVAAIHEGSAKISKSVVNGFFSYIRYDISQQISEFRPLVEAKMMELVKLRETCLLKKTQMTEDFARISERYTHIFNDLDRETSNRVKVLNQAAFEAVMQISKLVTWSADNSLFNTATVGNIEGSNTSAMLFASGLKYRTSYLIRKAKRLLQSDRNLKTMLKAILAPKTTNQNTLRHLPLVFLEVNNEKQQSLSSVKFDETFKGFQSPAFKTSAEQLMQLPVFDWGRMNENARHQLETYLQSEITKASVGTEAHQNRVSEMVLKLWNNNKSAILTNKNHA